MKTTNTIAQSNPSLDNSSNTVYGDFIALLFLALYLVIDFLPHFNSIEIINTQFFYLSLVNIVAIAYIFKNKIAVFYNYPLFSQVGLFQIIYFSFVVLAGCSLLFAKNISLSIISFSQILVIFLMIVNLILLFRDRLYLLPKIAFLIGISVFLQNIAQLGNFLKNFDNITNALNELKGNAANVNIFAASLNIKIPFLIIGVLQYENWKKWFLIVTFFLSTFIVVLISSRSAYLGLFFELIFFVIAYFKINLFSKNTFYNTLHIILPVLLSIVLANIIFKKGDNIGRFESVNTRILQIADVKEASAAARLGYWKNASEMIAKDPITGIGLGNWRVESIPYERKIIDEAFISSHTHNDFLEIATETGILNGIIYLSLFLLLFFTNAKTICIKTDKDKTIALLVLLIVIGYFIDAFFNFPLYRPTMQIAFAFMIVFTHLQVNNKRTLNTNSSKIGLGLLILSLLVTGFVYTEFKASQLEFKIKYDQPALSSTEIISKFPAIAQIGIYGESFYQLAAVAAFNEKDLIVAEKYFKLANTVNPYNGVSNWYLHKIEKSKDNQDRAYTLIKTAFYARPRTLNFYLDGLLMAAKKKDTTEILKIHKLFTTYRSMPANWIKTANALQKANYSPTKIQLFLKKGLTLYPTDSLLKVKTQGELKMQNIPTNINKDTVKSQNVPNYMIEAKKMGDAKQFDKAIELYKKELTLYPEKRVILQDIAVCYYSLNDTKTAISYLLRILNDPNLNDGKTEYLLAGCYHKIQDKTNSCKYLNLAIAKNFPGSKELFNQLCQ
ncbi:O-antigen ligase family protein [Flavobacterium sp. XS2P14]|uniref:O-antigen ligase family protein n=1 Tax=Flavobacterium sp. XS2P14 TaxID=3401735 RepID=UPI003AAD7BC6